MGLLDKIKGFARDVAPDTYKNIKEGLNSASVVKQLASGAKAAINLPKELVVQPFNRLAVQLGNEVVTGGDAKTITPKNKVIQQLVGKQPIESIAKEGGSAVETGYDLSKMYNVGQTNPNDPTAKFAAGAMAPFVGLAYGGIKALDIEGGGGKAAKKIAQEGVENLAKEGVEKLAKEGAAEATESVTKKLATQAEKRALSLVPESQATVSRETPSALAKLKKSAKNKPSPEAPAPALSRELAPQSPLPESAVNPSLSGTIPPVTAPSEGAAVSKTLSYTPSVPPAKPAYNTKYLGIDPGDAPEDLQKAGMDEFQTMAGKVKKDVVGKPVTFKEIQAMADDKGEIFDTLMSRDDTAKEAAQMLNLRRNITTHIQESRPIDSDFVAAIARDQAAAADVARKLNARKIIAPPEERTKLEAIIKKLTDDGTNAKKIIEMSKKYDLTDPEQQGKLYRELSKPGVMDWVDVIRYNSMLSSPLTHAVNAVGNAAGSGIIAPLEKLTNGALDFVRSAVTGGERTAFAGEAPAYMKGYAQNLGKATQNFWNFLSGKKLTEMPDIRSIPLTDKGTAGRVVENALNTPMRALEAMDQFFMTLAKGGEEASLIHRAAKGVGTKDMTKEANKKALYRLFRGGLKGEEQGHLLNMIDSVTGAILKGTNSQNPLTRTVTRFTFPFVKTPMNILKQGIEYSPLGFATTWGAKNKQEQIAKAIMGTATAAGIATMMGNRRLTGAAPSTKEEADRWRAAGIQPYSVKVGDNWVSYQKLHPVMSYNFALMTHLDDALNNGKISNDTFNKVMGVFAKQGQFLADQSYMKSIGELNQGLSGNPEKMTSFLSNYPQQLIPFRALMGWLTKAVDNVERQVDPNANDFEKQIQQFMTQIPGLSDNLQPRINPKTGQPIQRNNRYLNMISPVTITGETAEAPQIQKEIMSKQRYSDIAEEQTKVTNEQKRKALEVYWELKQMDKGEANGRAAALQKSDPVLYKRLEDVARSVKSRSDADAMEIKKLNIITGSRAKAVWRNLSKLETKEEKNGYLKDLYDLKVIDKEVLQQLADLKKKETPE